MLLKNKVTVLPALSFMVIYYAGIKPKSSVIIEGVVVSGQSSQPVRNAHVHVVNGEEESFTDKNGSYRINTWQQFPFALTLEHRDFETLKIKITESEKNQQLC